MTNQPTDTREAAIEQKTSECKCDFNENGRGHCNLCLFGQPITDEALTEWMELEVDQREIFEKAYRLGAASVDRVQIVREAFRDCEERMQGSPYWATVRQRELFRHNADAVLEAMEGEIDADTRYTTD